MTEPSERAGAAGASVAAPTVEAARAAAVTDFADGDWHRLHPATPLFRGGIAFIAIIGLVVSNLRERLIQFFVGGSARAGGNIEDDPIDFIIQHELVLVVLGGTLGVLLLCVLGFWLSWRMHTFRITDEAVEVRSGILFRTNRKGRLDRIQGINIARPIVPRLFGAAKLEISVAGDDANVPLSYLGSRAADALRRDILNLASGARREAASDAPAAAGGAAGLIESRVGELLAPELDPGLVAEPASVVRMRPGRLIGSTLLSETTIILVAVVIGLIVTVITTGRTLAFIGVLPVVLGIGGFLVTRITRSLRYSIAATPDGVRVGFGLLSTTNETLPPGRIHSVKVSQPLLWRPFGWWQIAVNRASRSSAQGAAGQQQTTILPVGDLRDVQAVLGLLLPEVATDELRPVIERGMTSAGGDDGFVNSPKRARWLRWFSQRRNGFAVLGPAVLLRTGAIWRALTIVPFARMQSVAVRQGPLLRRLDLAAVAVHTVAGPITPAIGAVDRDAALALFDAVAAAAIRTAQADTTHRWRASGPTAAPSPEPAAAFDPPAPRADETALAPNPDWAPPAPPAPPEPRP
ncbi:PH domain-containing protein [Microcella flavibacter]|uniref:PH domain-containing protein n=1 Tax=Microcella flavibacter TaxID=1804990 RepID=UPI001E3647E1|nr:PH domain-containing protein [Microcella flavibacter]